MFPTSYGLLESILSSEALIDTSNVAVFPYTEGYHHQFSEFKEIWL